MLYKLPGIAVTNYHKLGGLKHQKFILSGGQQLTSVSLGWNHSAGRSALWVLWENAFFASSSSWRWLALAYGCIMPFSASVVTLPPLLGQTCVCFPLARIHVIAFRVPQVIQDNLAILILNSITPVRCLLCHIRYQSQVPGIRRWLAIFWVVSHSSLSTDIETMDDKKQVIKGSSTSPQTWLNCKRKSDNFTVGKLARQHLVLMINVNITSNGTNRNRVLPGRVHWEKHGFTTITFLPVKMHNLHPILRKSAENWGIFCKITSLWSSESQAWNERNCSTLTESRDMW